MASSSQVIIPKINVQIPVDYSVSTTDEATIENNLEAGVVHYPTTALPGQNGNAAFFGHSSNNIFNPGKYKFAFVLLHTLVNGDTFYLTYNHTVYIYKVISTSVVSPNDIAVLGPVSGQTATATLITCDPPGTSINRLVVVGQQISPNPNTNTSAVATTVASTTPTSLPGNGPSLWARFVGSVEGKVVLTGLVIAVVVFGFRKLSKSRA
jgi:LPXTG-site transpeptidase (sortase) family protein